MVIDPTVLTVIAGTIVPLATGLISKKSATSGVKAIVNVTLSAVAAIALQASAHNGIITQDTLIQGFQVFGVGIAAYFGLQKPTGLAPRVASITGENGIG